MWATTLAALRRCGLESDVHWAAERHEGGERGGHGVAGAGGAGHGRFHRRTIDDAAVGAYEGAAARRR